VFLCSPVSAALIFVPHFLIFVYLLSLCVSTLPLLYPKIVYSTSAILMQCGEAEMTQQDKRGDFYQEYKACKELYLRNYDKSHAFKLF
jgi:hypothetical protein